MQTLHSCRFRGRIPSVIVATILAASAGSLDAQGIDGLGKALDDVVADALRNQMTPGAVVAVVQGDRIVLKAYGRTSLEPGARLLEADAVFRAAAATELVTALTATTLAVQGRLSLNARLGQGVPGLPPEFQGVTLEQLLTHTAGMAHQVAVPGRGGADDLGAAARQLTRFDRMTEPDALYSRSVPGIMLAALALQIAADRPYPDLVRSTVFEPLGMGSSTVGRPLADRGVAPGWRPSSTADAPITPVEPHADSAVTVPVRGLFASAADLARLTVALLNDGVVAGERLLPAGVAGELLRPRAAVPGSDLSAAAGVRIGTWSDRPSVRIAGGHDGHSALVHLLPDERIGVVILSNNEGAFLGDVADFIFRRMLGLSTPRPRRAAAAPPDSTMIAQLLMLAGSYENGSELIEIVVADGRPMLKSDDLLLELRPLQTGSAGALIDNRVALIIRLVTDWRGRTYLWLGDRALSPEAARSTPTGG